MATQEMEFSAEDVLVGLVNYISKECVRSQNTKKYQQICQEAAELIHNHFPLLRIAICNTANRFKKKKYSSSDAKVLSALMFVFCKASSMGRSYADLQTDIGRCVAISLWAGFPLLARNVVALFVQTKR